jgi:hypothetical protein
MSRSIHTAERTIPTRRENAFAHTRRDVCGYFPDVFAAVRRTISPEIDVAGRLAAFDDLVQHIDLLPEKPEDLPCRQVVQKGEVDVRPVRKQDVAAFLSLFVVLLFGWPRLSRPKSRFPV